MQYLSLILFTITTCGTPGPNNTMIMASGVDYGARRSVPHVAGINIGFPIMVMAVGLGLGGILHSWPVILDILRPIGVAYLLYLAYRIAATPVETDSTTRGKPLTFLQSALFQWVNPKAWIMAVGAVVTYATAPGNYLPNLVQVAIIMLVFGTPCTVAWLISGVMIKKVITKPIHFRIFNVVMASLLALSLIPVISEMFG